MLIHLPNYFLSRSHTRQRTLFLILILWGSPDLMSQWSVCTHFWWLLLNAGVMANSKRLFAIPSMATWRRTSILYWVILLTNAVCLSFLWVYSLHWQRKQLQHSADIGKFDIHVVVGWEFSLKLFFLKYCFPSLVLGMVACSPFCLWIISLWTTLVVPSMTGMLNNPFYFWTFQMCVTHFLSQNHSLYISYSGQMEWRDGTFCEESQGWKPDLQRCCCFESLHHTMRP